MRFKLWLALLSALVFCTALAASAATYYIAPIASGGDDYGDGSEYSPWATIARADYNYPEVQPSGVTAGDTIIIKQGTYSWGPDEGTIANIGGTSVNPITIKPQGNVKIVGGSTPGFKINGTNTDVHDIVIDGFEIVSSQANVPAVQLSGGVDRVTIMNCWLHGSMQSGTTATRLVDFIDNGCDSCVVRNNLFGCKDEPYVNVWQIYCQNTTNLAVYNNTFVNANVAVGLQTPANTNLLFKNNVISDMQNGVWYTYASGGTPVHTYNTYYNVGSAYGTGVALTKDATEINADPKFVAGFPYDYHLTACSPAVNSGTNVGIPYVGTAPDMGAYESAITGANATLTGKVTVATGGAALAGATVTLSSIGTTTTDAAGNYCFADITPGSYSVTATFGRGSSAETPVSLTGATSTVQNLSLDFTVKTFYVKSDGDDVADGESIATAWKHIDNGELRSLLCPGDTVLVQPGIYTSDNVSDWGVLIKTSGAPAFPITYKADGSGVVIDMSNAAPSAGFSNRYTAGVAPTTDVVIDGFEITGVQYGVFIEGGSRITVKNCYIHDCITTGTVRIYGLYVRGNVSGGLAYQSTDCKFINNVVANLDAADDLDFALCIGGYTKNAYYYNNTCDGADYGLYYVNTHVTPNFPNVNSQFKNNIVMNMRTLASLSNDLTTRTNNLYYNCTGAAPTDTNVVLADPLFVISSTYPEMYTLQNGSPAVDMGANVGLPCQGTGPDIGAFESSYVRAPVEYYVKTDGNDSLDGKSLANAWKTINRGDVLKVLKGNDIVHVQTGTWNASGVVAALRNCSGIQGYPIRYVAEPGVVLQGRNVGSVTNQSDYGFLLYAGNNNDIHDISIENFTMKGMRVGIQFQDWSRVTVKNCDIGTTTYTTVAPWGICQAHVAGYGPSNGNVFERNIIHNMPSSGYAIIMYGPVDGTHIYNNTIDNVGYGVYLSNATGTHTNTTIKNNIFSNCTANVGTIAAGITDTVHEYNLFYTNLANSLGALGTGEINGNAGYVGGSPYSYSLSGCSDAIDAGTELGNGFVFMGDGVDMGALEFDPVSGSLAAYLEGTVTNSATGLPMDNVVISSTTSGQSTKTDINGFYSLCISPAGSQVIRASYSGVFTDWSGSLTGGVTTTHDFTLNLPLSGQTYYVKNGGNDTLDGKTLANAWATIGNGDAKGLIKPGDIIKVQAGTYGNAVISNCGGVSGTGMGVTYIADGSVLLTCSGGPVLTLQNNANHTTLDGFEITGTTGAGLSALYVNGPDYVNLQNLYIHNTSVHDYTIKFQGVANGVIRNCLNVSQLEAWNWLIYACSNTQFINNTIVDGYVQLLNWNGSTNTIVKNNIFVGADQQSIMDMELPNTVFESYNCLWDALDYVNPDLTPDGTDTIAAPLFVGSGDYHLTDGSPCVDAGIDVGLAYQSYAPDLGRYESSYVGTPPGTPVDNIVDLQTMDLNTVVQMTSAKNVTVGNTTFTDGSIYVEETDRSSGIRLVPQGTVFPTLAEGDGFKFSGQVKEDANGERYIAVSRWNKDTGTVLDALGMTNKSFGSSYGPATTGLLVRIWGLVTYADSDFIYVDDSSGYDDGSSYSTGVRVRISGISPELTKTFEPGATFVKGITGIASMDGGVPCLKVRGDADIDL